MQQSTLKFDLEDLISRERLMEMLEVSAKWCIRKEESNELTKYQTGKKGKVFYLKSEVNNLFKPHPTVES